MAAGKPVADQREAVGHLDAEIRLGVVDRVEQNLARADDFDLAGDGRAAAAEQGFGGHLQAAQRAAFVVFDLDQGVGAINGRGQQRIGDADASDDDGNADDQPNVLKQGIQQVGQVDFIVGGVGRQVGRCVHG